MPCRFANSGTVATSRSASRAILALNVASNFLRDLVISVLHRLRQSRTLHTLTFGPISGVRPNVRSPGSRPSSVRICWGFRPRRIVRALAITCAVPSCLRPNEQYRHPGLSFFATNGWPMRSCNLRFAHVLANIDTRLGADVDRASFIAVELHHLVLAGLPARSP